MIAIDMTAQLAPIVWSMVGLLAISTTGIFFAAVHSRHGSLAVPNIKPRCETLSDDLNLALEVNDHLRKEIGKASIS